MWQDIVSVCRNNPQIVIFLALGIGYFIGKIKFFGFNLGSTAGVLVTALIIGQINVQVPDLLKTVAFALFIFCIGYKVGPQFFGALKKDGLKYIWLSFFLGIVGLIVAIVLGKLFGFGKGITAGLLGGALTQSSVLGTADGAINHLSVSAAQKTILQSNVAIAYAVTYIFGTAGLVVFYKMIPRIFKMDLKGEARKLEQEMGGGSGDLDPELFSWSTRLNLRAYKVTNKNVFGKTVQEIKTMFPDRVAIDKVKRGSNIFEPNIDTVIQEGDLIAVVGRVAIFLKAEEIVGPEVADKDVEDVIGELLKICVLNKDAVGKTLGELSKQYGHGCFLRRITRQGQEVPITRDTVIYKCDVLTVVGSKTDVERLVKVAGYPERPTSATDLVFVGFGCVLGTLIGLLAVKIGDIPITLGVGGGVLVAGLIFGWLRAIHPTFGRIPTGAQWVFTDLGLCLFVACVGLIAGPKAVSALKTTGISLFFAGVILTLVPHILGILFGKWILKLNPVLLFGALTGAGTCTAALNAVKEESDSAMPALGYTIPYAFGNVILTIWGTVLVNVM